MLSKAAAPSKSPGNLIRFNSRALCIPLKLDLPSWPHCPEPHQLFWSMSPKFPRKAETLLYVKLMFWCRPLKLPLLCCRTQWTHSWTPNFGLKWGVHPVSLGNYSISSSSRRSRLYHFVPPISEDSVATDQKPKQGGRRGAIKHRTIYPSACMHPEDTVPVQENFPTKFSTTHCSTWCSAFLWGNLEATRLP